MARRRGVSIDVLLTAPAILGLMLNAHGDFRFAPNATVTVIAFVARGRPGTYRGEVRLHLVADVHGRDVVVVGCGPAGAEKVSRLVAAGARVTAIDPALDALPATEGVVRLYRPFEPGDVQGAWLVVVATADETVNDAVAAAAAEAGVWIARSDRSDGGDVAFAAALDRGRVQIGVSTGGLSPSLARWIRDLVDDAIPAGVETMTELLSEVPRQDGRRNHRGVDFDAVLEAIDGGDLALARELLEIRPAG